MGISSLPVPLPAKEILIPLCHQADEIRAKMPQEDIWQDETEEEDEEEIPLWRKPYPSQDGVEMDSWMPKEDPVKSSDTTQPDSSVLLYQDVPEMIAAHFSTLQM